MSVYDKGRVNLKTIMGEGNHIGLKRYNPSASPGRRPTQPKAKRRREAKQIMNPLIGD